MFKFFDHKNTYHLSFSKFEQTQLFQSTSEILAAAIHRDNLIVAGKASEDGAAVLLLNLTSGKQLKTFKGHEKNIHCLLFLDDEYFVSASYDGVARIWNATTSTCYAFQAHNQNISSLIKLDKTFLTGSYDSTIKEWDFDGNLCHIYQDHKDSIFSLARLNSTQFCSLSTNTDKRILIWDSQSKSLLGQIDTSKAPGAFGLTAISDTMLATCGGQVCFWDVQKQCQVGQVNGCDSGTVAITKISENLIAVGSDRSIFFIDVRDQNGPLAEISLHSNWVSRIIPVGERIFTFGQDGVINSFNSEKFKLRSDNLLTSQGIDTVTEKTITF